MEIVKDLNYEVDEMGEIKLVKSIESVHKAKIRFTNTTQRLVDVWWRDFDGHRKRYKQLASGSHFDVLTQVTHPWEFTDAASGERYYVNGKPVFRVPRTLADIEFRTNWKIGEGTKSLKYEDLMAFTAVLSQTAPTATGVLELPTKLQDQCEEFVSVLIDKK